MIITPATKINKTLNIGIATPSLIYQLCVFETIIISSPLEMSRNIYTNS